MLPGPFVARPRLGDGASRVQVSKPESAALRPHRYPTFIDALRDLDDALSMCFLFSTFPRTGKCHVQTIQLCRRLTVEFLHYVIAARALRKVSAGPPGWAPPALLAAPLVFTELSPPSSQVFLSIKGIYYQAEVLGQPIVWITPYAFSHDVSMPVGRGLCWEALSLAPRQMRARAKGGFFCPAGSSTCWFLSVGWAVGSGREGATQP